MKLKYTYFLKESLHLSEEEKNIVPAVFRFMETELNSPIDDFTYEVIISQIGQSVNNEILQKIAYLLHTYFKDRLTEENEYRLSHILQFN